MSEEHDGQNELVPRIGTFLLLLGLFFFILFLTSDFAEQPDFDWLFLGLLLVAVGYVFRRRASPTPPTGRFGAIKKLREDARKRKEEKGKKK
jgi:hypothetical protein